MCVGYTSTQITACVLLMVLVYIKSQQMLPKKYLKLNGTCLKIATKFKIYTQSQISVRKEK